MNLGTCEHYIPFLALWARDLNSCLHVPLHMTPNLWVTSNWLLWEGLNTLRPRQDVRHFPEDILKCIFLNENVWISLTISLKCVRKVRINNIPSLVQIMAWRRPGNKLLSEPMMVNLPTHICVTRPQWVNHLNNDHHEQWKTQSWGRYHGHDFGMTNTSPNF